MKNFKILLSLNAALFVAMPSGAWAQAADKGALAAETSADSDAIIVTARRRAENVQDIPVAVTALGAEALERAGIKDINDVQYQTPSFNVAPGFFGRAVPAFMIRGQSGTEILATQDAPVVIYFNDVPMQRANGLNQIIYDMDNVQVLKGPQGTLFGRNTTGGAVLVNTKRPDLDDVNGYVTALYGNFEQYSIEGAVNFPLTDKLALRVAARLQRRDGFTRDLADGELLDDDSNEAYRASLLWTPTENLEILTVYQGFHLDTNGAGRRLTNVRPSFLVAPTGNAATPATIAQFNATPQFAADFATLKASDFRTVFNDVDNVERATTWQIGNTISLDAGDVTIKNIFGYRKVKSFSTFDYDGTRGTYILPGDGTRVSIFNSQNTFNGDQYTNELQASGTTLGGALDYIVGGFYFREKNFDNQVSVFLGRRTNTGTGINTSKSLFGQATYRTPLEGLSLTGGFRYTWDTRRLKAQNQIQGATEPALRCRLTGPGNVVLNPCLRDVSTNFRKPSWTVTADYKINDDVLVYLAHRRGYRSGGWNLRSVGVNDTVPFRPERVLDVEAGFKTNFDLGMDIRGHANVAAYHQWYNDIQRTVTMPSGGPGSPLITTIFNAAKAKIKGVEIEAGLQKRGVFKLDGFAGIIKAKYNEFISFTPQGVQIDNSSAEFDHVPEFTAGVTAQVYLPIPEEMGEFSVTGNWYHTSLIFLEPSNDGGLANGTNPGYDLFNLYVDLNKAGGTPVDVRFFMKNVFDKEYFSNGLGLYGSLGYVAKTLGDPRTYGLQVRYNF